MKINMKNNIKAIILGLVLTVGMGYAVAATFTGPQCAPPGCNTDAPLTVGGNDLGITPYSQLKTGLLTLMSVITPDLTVRNADSSPVTPGQVLMAKDATGKVGWGFVSSPVLGIGLVAITESGASTGQYEITRVVNVPEGATFAKITAVGAGSCTTYSGQAASQVCVDFSPGGLAQKTISLSGINQISVTMKTSYYGIIMNADVVFGSPAQTISTYTTIPIGGGRTKDTNIASGGDINGYGPYFGYGNDDADSKGLVLIEWY